MHAPIPAQPPAVVQTAPARDSTISANRSVQVEQRQGSFLWQVTATPAEPLLSDEIEVLATLQTPAEVRWEPLPAEWEVGQSFGTFRIVAREQLPLQLLAGTFAHPCRFLLQPTQTGMQTLPPLTIRFRTTPAALRSGTNALPSPAANSITPNTQATSTPTTAAPAADLTELVTLTAPPLTLNVQTSLPADTAAAIGLEELSTYLAPPTAPVAVPVPEREPTFYQKYSWRILQFGLVVLILLIIRLVQVYTKPTPKRPDQLALEELDWLLVRQRRQPDAKQFIVELTMIVRQYLERTTGVQAPELTTAEFLQSIQKHPRFPEPSRQLLAQFLLSADLVKFAGLTPDQSLLDGSTKAARQVIGIFQPNPVAEKK